MKKILTVITILLLGVGLLAYPHAAKYLSSLQQSTAIQEFAEQLNSYDEELLAEEWQKAQAYNQKMTGQGIEDPFIEGSGKVMPEDYLELLNVGGTMGYIEIPRIQVKLSIYHGTSTEVLDKGVGHLEGSSLPVGGEGTHTVLTGHTGVPSGKLFTDLIEVTEGDIFYLHILDQVLAYQVDQIKVVEPSNVEDLRTIAGGDYATLITCTPYGVNSHRLLVRGVRIPYEEAEEAEKQEVEAVRITTEDKTLIRAGVITSAVMFVLIIMTSIMTKRRRKKEQRYWWNDIG